MRREEREGKKDSVYCIMENNKTNKKISFRTCCTRGKKERQKLLSKNGSRWSCGRLQHTLTLVFRVPFSYAAIPMELDSVICWCPLSTCFTKVSPVLCLQVKDPVSEKSSLGSYKLSA